MDEVSVVGKLKSVFTRYGTQLRYIASQSRFSWCERPAEPLPQDCGVYCLFSHGDSRLQKVGKTERKGGLRRRFGDYTGKKTELKLRRDATDQRWSRAMTEALIGEHLSVYYFVTAPIKVRSPVQFEDGSGHELECHWARSFEAYISGLARDEYRARNRLDTHRLLSGLADENMHDVGLHPRNLDRRDVTQFGRIIFIFIFAMPTGWHSCRIQIPGAG